MRYPQTTIEHISHRKKFKSATSVRVPLRLYTLLSVTRSSTGIQLSLAKKHHLPLFLHSRAAHRDFVEILREEGFGDDGGRAIGAHGGVVHSFTGTPEEALELVTLRLSNHSNTLI